MPIGAGPERTPMDAVIAATAPAGKITSLRQLPFRNALAGVTALANARPSDAAQSTLELYHQMLSELDCHPPSDSYNLLSTRDWMWLVPRSVEKFRSISVNSLGFAGSLLVRNEEELELVRGHGPLNILREVALADRTLG